MMSQDNINTIVAIIQKLMHKLYTQLDDYKLQLIIYQSPMSFNKPSSPMYKFSLHGFWPGVKVNVQVACTICCTIIHHLHKAFGKWPAYNQWVSVLNESVYKPNSLHMFASAKAKKCHACGSKGKTKPKEMVLCCTTDVHPKCKCVTPNQLLPCMTCLEVSKTHIGHAYHQWIRRPTTTGAQHAAAQPQCPV